MFEIVETPEKDTKRTINMRDMKPLQVGKIVGDTIYVGHIVMKTQMNGGTEVLDLSHPESGSWSRGTLTVELLPPGEEVHLRLFNEVIE